jgi:hypothetical protein
MINSTVLSISLAMYALLAIHVLKKTFNVWEITFSINNWPKIQLLCQTSAVFCNCAKF